MRTSPEKGVTEGVGIIVDVGAVEVDVDGVDDVLGSGDADADADALGEPVDTAPPTGVAQPASATSAATPTGTAQRRPLFTVGDVRGGFAGITPSLCGLGGANGSCHAAGDQRRPTRRRRRRNRDHNG